MTCKKCKEKTKIGEKYCARCGTKLESEPIRLPKISKKVKLWTLSIILGICIIIGGYQVGSFLTSPSWIAKNYFIKVINNDINGIYETINLKDGTFYSKEQLKEKMNLLENVEEYNVVSVDAGDKEALATIEYYLKNDPTTYYANVKLYQTNQKKWLFYDTWKVDSGAIAEDVTIEVPKGANITIDEKSIENMKNEKKSSDTLDVYTIDAMAKGDYQFVISLEDGISITDTISVKGNTVYTLGNITLPDTLETNLREKLQNTMEKLYQGALQNQAYSDIKNSLTDTNSDNIESTYLLLKKQIQKSLISYTDIQIRDLKTETVTMENGKLQVTYRMTHDDTGNYTVGETKTEYQETDLKTRVQATYEKKDGNYVLIGLQIGR